MKNTALVLFCFTLYFAASICTGCMSTGDLYSQKVDSDGNAVWAPNGIPVRASLGDQNDPRMITDDEGGMIITWGEVNSSTAGRHIQRVRSDGSLAWSADGVHIVKSAGSVDAEMTTDNAGGAILTWNDLSVSPQIIHAQRVLSNGSLAWPQDGIPLGTATEYGAYPHIVSDGVGGAVVAWIDASAASDDYGIYAQRVKSDGTLAWPSIVSVCTVDSNVWRNLVQLVSDGAGGAIVTWADFHNRGEEGLSVYAQRVLSNGTPAWEGNGIPICAAHVNHLNSGLQAIVDGMEGVIIAWEDIRGEDLTGLDIYAQRVLSDGTEAWADDGVPVCTAMNGQKWPQLASDGAGGAILTWYDRRIEETSGCDIYVQRVLSDGTMAWGTDGELFCGAADDQWAPRIAADGAGGAIVAWWDGRGGVNWDIYAQRVLFNGIPAWEPEGVLYCDLTGHLQDGPIADLAMISDGSGRALLVWYNQMR